MDTEKNKRTYCNEFHILHNSKNIRIRTGKNNIEYSHEKIREAIKKMEYSEIRLKDKLFALRANLNDFQKAILKTLKIEKPKK
nr:hypothetical protein [Marinitoga lauensis]